MKDQTNKEKKLIHQARNLLRQQELAVLSTHSKSTPEYPFGSVTTYISSVKGETIFYISNLAQHTRNILNNPKMCLTVFEGNQNDPNAGARLSIMGEAELVEETDIESVKQRFFALYPDSREYQKMHDFNFYILKTKRVRYIGGFGDINWISKEQWDLETPLWLDNEQDMITHMNQDHQIAMQLICSQRQGFYPNKVEMLAINPDGFFIRADNRKPIYFDFGELVMTGDDVRKALVNMTNSAREEHARINQRELAS